MLFRLASVPLQVSPSSARVDVPGWFNWRSGDRLYLLPGSHRLQATASGYAAREVEVDVEALAGKPVEMALALLPGEVTVDTGGVAGELLVDGKSLGTVPGVIRIPAGDHDISLRAPRHVDHVARLQVQGGGRRQSLQVKLLPSFGWLVLDTSPAGAVVRIDGQERGRAPLRLELDAGLRDSRITAPGRRGWNSQVAISRGRRWTWARWTWPRRRRRCCRRAHRCSRRDMRSPQPSRSTRGTDAPAPPPAPAARIRAR